MTDLLPKETLEEFEKRIRYDERQQCESLDATILDSFKIGEGHVEMTTHGGAGHRMLVNFANLFESNGGINYFTTTFELEGMVRKKRRRYAITIVNLDGNLSPAEVIQQLKEENKKLTNELARLRK